MAEPVAVTGVGMVCAAGIGRDRWWSALVDAPSGPTPAGMDAFDPSPWFAPAEARRTDPYLQYSVAAASLALEDAGSPHWEADRAGVAMANVYGAAGGLEAQRDVLDRHGPRAVSPLLAAQALEDACASQLSLRFGLRGPSRLVGASCAGGTAAIGDGAALVADRRCDVVLAGGVLGPITPVLHASYDMMRVLSHQGWSRPFDRRRDGFVIADGACVLVLESAEHARRRGARIQAWIIGWAQTNDAHHIWNPSGDGLQRCLREAADHAGIRPTEIRHVNAHAAGTVVGDAVEADAIATVFGPGRPSVTAIKGRMGHTLSAAGAFEAASVVLSFEHRCLAPSAVEFEADPVIDVDLVHTGARSWDPAPTISASVGLGGQNACVVLAPPT